MADNQYEIRKDGIGRRYFIDGREVTLTEFAGRYVPPLSDAETRDFHNCVSKLSLSHGWTNGFLFDFISERLNGSRYWNASGRSSSAAVEAVAPALVRTSQSRSPIPSPLARRPSSPAMAAWGDRNMLTRREALLALMGLPVVAAAVPATMPVVTKYGGLQSTYYTDADGVLHVTIVNNTPRDLFWGGGGDASISG